MIPPDPYVEPFPGEIHYRWKVAYLDGRQKEWLIKYYPHVETKRLAAMMHRTGNYIIDKFARELGLRKTDRARREIFLRGQHKANIARQKVMKGRRPSAKSLQALKDKYWAKVRSGERLDPVSTCRQRDPEYYAEYTTRNARKFHLKAKMERLRIMSGMKQETKIRVVMNGFTKSQKSHRHNALVRGYWYYADSSDKGGERYNIYYDEHTQRAPRFEANLKKDGFNVLDGTGL